MKADKKKQAETRLVDFVRGDRLKMGARLPSERVMAEMFETSRTTIREMLRGLEEKGIVRVMRGSGVYLRCDYSELSKEFSLNGERSHFRNLHDYFEARYVILAEIVRNAALKADDKQLNALHDATVKLGTVILKKNLNEILTAEHRYMKIIADMTRNAMFMDFMKNILWNHRILWEELFSGKESPDDQLFAGYVNLCNAMRDGDPGEAYRIFRDHTLEMCGWLAAHVDPSFTGTQQHLKKLAGDSHE